MLRFKRTSVSRVAILVFIAALAFGVTWPLVGKPQDKDVKPRDKSEDLISQIAELRAKVAELEAALARSKSGMAGMPNMTMMDDDMMMGGGQKGMGSMSAMTGMMEMDTNAMGAGGNAMMDDGMDMMGMMGKGSMDSGMMKMKITSALPGFPGASHIYHIGATEFFLNHREHITLSIEQQTQLNDAKRTALLEKANSQRQIDQAEQELWELTGADEPDSAQIETKVGEIERMRSEQRLAFIRAVGEAGRILTDEQRKALLGHSPPAPSNGHSSDPSHQKPAGN